MPSVRGFGLHRTAITATAIVGAAVIAGALAVQSTTLAIGLLSVVSIGIFLLVARELRRPLLAALFLLAPVDISKAIIAPLVSRYYAAGPYYSPGLYLSLAHMVLLLLVIVWLGRRLFIERRLPPMTAVDGFALIYVVYIWLRSVGTPQGILSIGSAASYTLAVLGFYAASHTIQSTSDLRLVVRTSLAAILMTFIYVALQALTQSPLPLPGAKALASGAILNFGGDKEVFRPSGFTNHPNALAHYLIIVLPPSFALALLGPRRIPSRVWWIAVAVTLGAGMSLLVTLSRGGWASFVLSAAVVVAVYTYCGLINRRQLGFAAVAVVIGTIILLVIYPNILLRLTAPDNRSLESRVLLADMAFTIIEANPFTGIGFGGYNRAAYEYSAPLFATVTSDYQLALHQLVVHNHFLLIGAELGVPAMLLFIYLLWRFIKLPLPFNRWRDPGAFALAIGLSAAVVGETLFLNSDNYYADIRVFLFWLAGGVLQALVLNSDRERTR